MEIYNKIKHTLEIKKHENVDWNNDKMIQHGK